MVEALVGLRRVERGTIAIDGVTTPGRVRERRPHGLAYVPADRDQEGACLPATLTENLLAGRQRRPEFRSVGILRWDVIRHWAADLLERFEIRGGGPRTAASSLSGGNLQRVVVARELGETPRLLMPLTQPAASMSRRRLHSPSTGGSARRRRRYPAGLGRTGRAASLGRPPARPLRWPHRRRAAGQRGNPGPARRLDDRLGGVSTTPASSAARLVLPAHLASGAALLAPFALALAVGGIVLTATGRDALGTYRLLLDQSFGGQIAFANTLVATTPILLAGLATAIAFRAGVFTIGVEGSLYLGAFAAAWVGFTFTDLSGTMLAPLAVLVAAVTGALWSAPGGAAGLARRRRGGLDADAQLRGDPVDELPGQ